MFVVEVTVGVRLADVVVETGVVVGVECNAKGACNLALTLLRVILPSSACAMMYNNLKQSRQHRNSCRTQSYRVPPAPTNYVARKTYDTSPLSRL